LIKAKIGRRPDILPFQSCFLAKDIINKTIFQGAKIFMENNILTAILTGISTFWLVLFFGAIIK
jgi:hypothetical protein